VPGSFAVAPVNGNSNVSFEVSYSATGTTSTGSTLGATPTIVNPGLTTLSVDVLAQKSTGVLPQGAYQTEVVVRCE
jgi:hypothetical protein